MPVKSKKKLLKESEQQFVEYCKQFYWNASCTSSKDFYDDMKRFKIISKLFKKYHTYKSYDSLKENLIINHLIVLQNVFGEDKIAELLFKRIETKYHNYLYTFLLYLNVKNTNLYNYQENERIVKKLSAFNYK